MVSIDLDIERLILALILSPSTIANLSLLLCLCCATHASAQGLVRHIGNEVSTVRWNKK